MTPTQSEIDDMHRCYAAVYKSNFGPDHKSRCLSSILGSQDWSWKVVKISREAIKWIRGDDCEFKYRPGLHRAHLIDRATTASKVFGGDLMEPKAWWKLVSESDQTWLVHKKQHTKRLTLADGEMYPVPERTPLLFRSKGYRCTIGEPEVAFIKELLQKHAIS